MPFGLLLEFLVITEIDAFGATLETGPFPPGFERMLLKISAVDSDGQTRGDAIFLP